MQLRFHLLTILSVLLLCFGGTPACTDRTETVDELYRHTEALTALLEQHWADPAAAVAAIEAYEAKHAHAITRLIADSRKIRADLGQRSKRQLRARWEERSAELRKRLEKLTEAKQR